MVVFLFPFFGSSSWLQCLSCLEIISNCCLWLLRSTLTFTDAVAVNVDAVSLIQ